MNKQLHIAIHCILAVAIIGIIVTVKVFISSSGYHTIFNYARFNDGNTGYLYDVKTGEYKGERSWRIDMLLNGSNHKSIGTLWVSDIPLNTKEFPGGYYTVNKKTGIHNVKFTPEYYDSTTQKLIHGYYEMDFYYDSKEKMSWIAIWENEDTDNGFLSMVLIPAGSKEDADVIYQHMKGNFTPR